MTKEEIIEKTLRMLPVQKNECLKNVGGRCLAANEGRFRRPGDMPPSLADDQGYCRVDQKGAPSCNRYESSTKMPRTPSHR